MSGGSHGYVFGRIEDELCGQMHDRELDDLMKDIAKLAHDLEWYDSNDICEETYRKSVAAFKEKWFKQPRETRLTGYIDEAVNRLRDELRAMIGPEPPGQT